MPLESTELKEKRIAVCFFGITRSLSYTIESIRSNVLEPAHEHGQVRVFAHLFSQASIDNPRSEECGPLNVGEFRLLNADQVELEEPGLCLDSMDYKRHLLKPDPWGDDYRSLSNFLHQLHSLDRIHCLASEWKPDVYVFVRPDLRYLDSLGVFIRQALCAKDPTIFYPNWQHHGGMNDRFAIVSGESAAQVYSTRKQFVWEFSRQFGGVFNGERLLKFSTLKMGVRTLPIYARAERVRSNGECRTESFRRPRGMVSKTTWRYLLHIS